jgi:hypothetical protein
LRPWRIAGRASFLSSGGVSAETETVSKSTFAIAALGAGACVLLSLMMQELVQHDGSARRVAYLPQWMP